MHSATATVVVDDSGTSAEVHIEYQVGPLAFGQDRVDGRILLFEGTDVRSVMVDGAEARVRLTGDGAARAVSLPVGSVAGPSGGRPGRAGTDGPASLSVRYRVEGAVSIDDDGARVRLRVPLLTLLAPPADTGPGLFQAELRLPDAWKVSEGFPTTLRSDGSGGHTVTLPVVPALISARARTDGGWRPGLPGVLDMVAVFSLVGFFLVTRRHLMDDA